LNPEIPAMIQDSGLPVVWGPNDQGFCNFFLQKTYGWTNSMGDSDSTSSGTPRYHRVILKLSGESLAHAGERGISMDEVTTIARQIKSAHELGCQIAVVVGGGNILRGAQFKGSAGEKIQEATAHYMGMLATVINALALQDALEGIGITTRVMSAIKMDGVAEPFIRRRAIRHLEKGRIVILAAGTGAPYVTTDTCAANRGLELDADIVLKATRVDGVYSEDPEKNPHAILYRELDYDTVIEKNLKVMDSTAIAQCRTHQLPILIFNFKKEGNIVKAISGQRVGTRISPRVNPGERILVNAN
jgi:uridylate kinase